MGKAKRYGYIFTWHLGDHLPIHIHVYKNGKLICRWMLYEDKELSGHANKKIRSAIRELSSEGIFKNLEKKRHENN